MTNRVEDIQQYIADRVHVDSAGCWSWALSRTAAGYGMCFRRDWRGYAHRFTYTRMVGPIPDGLQIDHLCRNRACVNPEHLEPVDQGENQRRANYSKSGRNYTVYQIANGKWRASVEIPESSRRRRKTIQALSEDAVTQKMEEWLSQQGVAV